jgi:hypothetical protein
MTYKCGASDMRFGGLLDQVYTITSAEVEPGPDDFETHSNPRLDFNKDFEPIHPAFTGYAVENLVFGETLTTLREYAHRMMPMQRTVGAATFPYLLFSRASAQVKYGQDVFALFYRFWSGSVRVKGYLNDFNVNAIMYSYYTPENTCIVGAPVNNPTNNSMEAEWAYYEGCAFDVISHTSALVPKVYETRTSAGVYWCKGYGDDFSYRWLILPPAGIYSNPTTDQGTRGLAYF